ncbi:hypothetical protein HF086_010756 [Spodoptera exigua]|uniref:Uncharacterized protein n=1 Tax=Spodoptera exigua TaxID=7107 RepID=A0A922S7Y1_SPOEX|nr:hypothetical protein HF086_010756 [Spodoptera exigua]
MNFLENITFRRRRSKGSESNQDDSNNTSQTLNYTTNSMPEMSEDDETHEIKKLQDKIDELTSQLNNANKKVEILCLEISSLKEKNQELSKKNDSYVQKVTSSHQQQSTISKRAHSRQNKLTKTNRNIGNITSHQDSRTENKDVTLTSSHNRILNNVIKPHQHDASIKHKLCILSGEKSSRICKLIDNNYSCSRNNYEICHYRKPNCNLEIILDNIDKKVQNFTKSDFCVICIGDEDFKRTQNYIELVVLIPELKLLITYCIWM